jgi:hypothetical protein
MGEWGSLRWLRLPEFPGLGARRADLEEAASLTGPNAFFAQMNWYSMAVAPESSRMRRVTSLSKGIFSLHFLPRFAPDARPQNCVQTFNFAIFDFLKSSFGEGELK